MEQAVTLDVRRIDFICIRLRHEHTFVNVKFSAEFYDPFLLVIFVSLLGIFVFNFHALNRLCMKL